ncbi:MAG: hypothetical protein JW798_04585 [Prolixibacteraceae bacterium]|nr:hypothetical protein [Prolixibacteraceae bacterium]
MQLLTAKLIVFLLLFAASLNIKAQVFDIVVDINGGGDFISIQEAINAVPDNQHERTLIFIRSGLYQEKIVVPSSKNNVSLTGENVDNVVLSWNDYAGSSGLSSAETYTFLVEGSDFYMENITVQNTAGKVGQALAVRTVGDRGIYKNCRFLGFQDTYYAHKNRQYNFRCYVEGGTDFVYGDATAVFDQCTINCLQGGQYISAPADAKLITEFTSGNTFFHGIVFRECNITAEEGVADHSYYLGRPWQPKSSVVYLNCTLGPHIKPVGWSTWDGNNHESSYFAEYKSVDTEGNPVDTTQRAAWSYQVSDAWYNNFYKYAFFFRKDKVEWDPVTPTKTLETPKNIRLEGNTVLWDPVEDAIGYLVYLNGEFVAMSATNEMPDNAYTLSELEVKSVRDNGVVSTPADDHLLNKNNTSTNYTSQTYYFIENDFLFSAENISITIYTCNGQFVQSKPLNTVHDLSSLKYGHYILAVQRKNGTVSVLKFLKTH